MTRGRYHHLEPPSKLATESHLRFFGHILRRPADRLVQRVLRSLSGLSWKKPPDRQRKFCTEVVKEDLRALGVEEQLRAIVFYEWRFGSGTTTAESRNINSALEERTNATPQITTASLVLKKETQISMINHHSRHPTPRILGQCCIELLAKYTGLPLSLTPISFGVSQKLFEKDGRNDL
ncbi:hypothetical protein RB195_017539 [Necator americanus]|uniref:Uncharacterized protein n=1 Tax=Necator americanus TaxID=51031 RepID=A0ABR1C5Q0_NECAM